MLEFVLLRLYVLTHRAACERTVAAAASASERVAHARASGPAGEYGRAGGRASWASMGRRALPNSLEFSAKFSHVFLALFLVDLFEV
jgi:hypothetical protein